MRQPKPSYAHFLFLTVAVSAGTSLVLSVGMYSGMQLLSNLTSPTNIFSNTATDDSDEESEFTPTPRSPGNSGNGNGDCVLRLSSCAPSEVTCIESAVFVRVSCSDSRCLLPNNVCTAISGAATSAASSAASQMQETVRDTNSGNSDHTTTTENDRRDTTNGSDSVTIGDDTSGRGGSDSTAKTLGCYDSTGTWTEDRSQCATDQRQFLPSTVSATRNPPVLINGLPTPPSPAETTTTPTTTAAQTEIATDQQDITLQTRFREIFRNDEEQKAALADLLSTASNALERLQILQNTTLAPDASAIVTDTYTWVTELIRSLSAETFTLKQLQAKADELKTHLQATAQIVAVSVPTVVRKPESLISKMDTILLKIPTVFSYMTEQGASASPEAISEYQVAVGLYSPLRPKCLVNADDCLGMAGIIGHLETMRTDIAASLAASGKTDLQNQIDAMMQ